MGWGAPRQVGLQARGDPRGLQWSRGAMLSPGPGSPSSSVRRNWGPGDPESGQLQGQEGPASPLTRTRWAGQQGKENPPRKPAAHGASTPDPTEGARYRSRPLHSARPHLHRCHEARRVASHSGSSAPTMHDRAPCPTRPGEGEAPGRLGCPRGCRTSCFSLLGELRLGRRPCPPSEKPGPWCPDPLCSQIPSGNWENMWMYSTILYVLTSSL